MTSLNYDITKDGLYIKGYQKGLELGLKKFEVKIEELEEKIEKIKEWKIGCIKRMLLDGRFTQKDISIFLKVSISFVRKIKKELDAEK